MARGTWKTVGYALIAASQLGIVERLPAQAPIAVAPAPTTLWNFLGIPQGVNKIKDATSNKFGNFPGLERKPPLKRIGDPANLASKNPAIAAAAQIKQEEDLAAQKIKAIKYLATIGCGCYDKKIDPPVKVALMAALDDCTERVRFEAAKAIGEAAATKCSVCGQNCCCDEDMAKKLAEIAFERDEHGCCLESSERVRNSAREALMICCRSRQAPYDAMPVGPTESIPSEEPRDVLPQPEQRDLLPEAPMPVPQVRRPNPPALRMPQQQVSQVHQYQNNQVQSNHAQQQQGQLFAPPGFAGQRVAKPMHHAVGAAQVRAFSAPSPSNVPTTPQNLAVAKSVEAMKPAMIEAKPVASAVRLSPTRKPVIVTEPELSIESEAKVTELAKVTEAAAPIGVIATPVEAKLGVSKHERAIETEAAIDEMIIEAIEETIAESTRREPVASTKREKPASKPAIDDTTAHELESSPLLRVTVAAKPHLVDAPAPAPTRIVAQPPITTTIAAPVAVAPVESATKPGVMKLAARIVAKTTKSQAPIAATPAASSVATTSEDEDRAAAVRLAVRTIVPAETLKTAPPQSAKKPVEVSTPDKISTPVEAKAPEAPAASIKLALTPKSTAPRTVTPPSGAAPLQARIVAPTEPTKEVRQIIWVNE